MKNNKVVYGWFDGRGCFYVGMGSKRRSRSKHQRNSHCSRRRDQSEKNKTFNVIIFDDNLTLEQACQLEIDLISELGRRDLGTGCLTNMTNGGEKSNYWKGKSRSQKTKDKIRKTNTGKKHLQKTKDKMSKAKRKPVQTPDGKFESSIEARIHYKVCKQTFLNWLNDENKTEFYRIGYLSENNLTEF